MIIFYETEIKISKIKNKKFLRLLIPSYVAQEPYVYSPCLSPFGTNRACIHLLRVSILRQGFEVRLSPMGLYALLLFGPVLACFTPIEDYNMY